MCRVEVEGYCPFCNAHHNHLHLNTDKNKWHCKRCGASGNSVMLYGRVHGLNNKTAFRELTQDGLGLYALKRIIDKGNPCHIGIEIKQQQPQ